MSDIEESAKAVQEVAKTTNNAIDKTAELSRFLGRILGPAFDDMGGILKQYTEYWKQKNALRLRDKLEKILSQRGDPPLSPLAFRTGLPLLDAAVMEDEEGLQNMWANLLASAMTEEEYSLVTKSYVEVLKQIDVLDAELIDVIYKIYLNVLMDGGKTNYIKKDNSTDVVQLSLATNNLERLGLVKLHKDSAVEEYEPIIRIYFCDKTGEQEKSFAVNVSLTLFGSYFMRACTDHKVQAKNGHEFVLIESRFDYLSSGT
ncbi:Abi-alpha family protein [Delftia acidovorans]|uniref:Abi-alpha family protein n=1 Tax=Delftia acidovorans TaxID=80866 RepID=UPI0028EFD697|nr:Abi-alpha family protein [Delftia acidovorans]